MKFSFVLSLLMIDKFNSSKKSRSRNELKCEVGRAVEIPQKFLVEENFCFLLKLV